MLIKKKILNLKKTIAPDRILSDCVTLQCRATLWARTLRHPAGYHPASVAALGCRADPWPHS